MAIGAAGTIGSGVTGAGAGIGAASAGDATGAAGLTVLIRRGAGITGAAGFGGSGARAPGFLTPGRAGAGACVSANDAFDGTLMPRWRASRLTNSRATTSSIVLDALFTSMP